MIPNLTIRDLTIDCANAERTRDFYVNLMGWEKTAAFDCIGLKTDNGLTIRFMEIEQPYVPPIWPEEPGKQQKQMHLDFLVDDLPRAMDRARSLGAAKAAIQYCGEEVVTMLDPQGRPFCLCKRPEDKSEFDLWYEKKGYGSIPSISVNIDCEKSEALRAFYAGFTQWDQDFHDTALIDENRMVIHFMGCDGDFAYIPPVWPEAPGKQQKQMQFNFQVDDLQSAVDEAIRLGAAKATVQSGGNCFVTMIDTQGHSFCLYSR